MYHQQSRSRSGRTTLGAISDPQIIVPGSSPIPNPDSPMVKVTITPRQQYFVVTPHKSPPRRSKRGYRWVPVTPPSSNDRSNSNCSSDEGHSSGMTSAGSSGLPKTRKSPRKRLVYFSDERSNPPTPKKVKLDFEPKPLPPLKASLHALSNDQLIAIIGNIAQDHPELEEELRQMIPKPDLKDVDAKLKQLRCCVHKALPRISKSRIQSKTDAVAFARTEVHMYSLKKFVFETGGKLLKSEYWSSLVDYAIMAWNSVGMTPVWDRPLHNEIRNECYEYLTKLLVHGIQKGNFSNNELIQISKETNLLAIDNPCSKRIKSKIEALLTKDDDKTDD